MPTRTPRGHVSTSQPPTVAIVSASSLTEAFEGLETDVPTSARGLEAEIIALRESIDELIFILKLVHDV